MLSRLQRLALLTTLVLAAAVASAQPVTVEIDLSTLPETFRSNELAVGVRGDTPPLAWDRSQPLTDTDGDGVYTAALDFPEGTGLVAYKVVLDRPGTDLTWEPGDNRILVPGRMARDRRAFGATQTDLPPLTVSQRQLAEDVSLLRAAIQALHPGLFLHNSQSDVEALSNRLGSEVRRLGAQYGEAIPMPAAYLPISEAVAGIRDGHTQVSMYNQGTYLAASLYGRADRIPFTFRLVGDRMIVTADATADERLPIGTEILTLDGRSVNEVVDALLPYASADGSNDANRRDRLQVTADPAPAERFDVIYSLLFAPGGDLELTIRQPDGTQSTLAVPRMTANARTEALLERNPALPRSNDDLLEFRFLDGETGYLKIGTFATFNMDLDYAEWLANAFQEMNAAGTRQLVVDLRGTPGGMDEAAALLLQHLITEPTEITFWQGITAYNRVPESLRPHVNSWTSDYLDLSDRATRRADGMFEMPARSPITLPPAPDAFTGKAVVLVDAAASSATFYLAQTIQQTGAVPLVGQETGGSRKGLNAGQMVFLTLPNTGIVVDVPLFGARPSEPGPDRGIVPDVLVAPDADAVIAGRDPELEAALALLAGETVQTAKRPLPLADLAGDWMGTLTYTDYGDDASQATLTTSAEVEAIPGGVRLAISFIEPNGSSGGTSLLTLRNGAVAFEYDGLVWTELEREVMGDTFRIVIEREGEDNNLPATIRHTLAYREGTLTDRKEVRYAGTDRFFERNVAEFTR